MRRVAAILALLLLTAPAAADAPDVTGGSVDASAVRPSVDERLAEIRRRMPREKR